MISLLVYLINKGVDKPNATGVDGRGVFLLFGKKG
jgi:hypothetical protein